MALHRHEVQWTRYVTTSDEDNGRSDFAFTAPWLAAARACVSQLRWKLHYLHTLKVEVGGISCFNSRKWGLQWFGHRLG